VRLLYRENKEQDITTALGQTKARSPQLRKRTRRQGRSFGELTQCITKTLWQGSQGDTRTLNKRTRESTPEREFQGNMSD
jgi:hypothetical protein